VEFPVRIAVVAPIVGVDNLNQNVKVAPVDGRKGTAKLKRRRPEVGRVIRQQGQPEPAARPEKTDCFCEEQPGFGTAKAVIASGVVTVHASTLSAPSQERATRA